VVEDVFHQIEVWLLQRLGHRLVPMTA